jgi:signal transduction histidine kinase
MDVPAYPKPKKTQMTQICVNIGELSLTLSQLRDLVNQQCFAEYWQGGLNAVRQQLGAAAGRLYLVDAQLPRNDDQVTVGEISPTVLEYLIAWEEALLDATAEKEHQQAVLWSVKGVTERNGLVAPQTALHLCLWTATTLQGMATVVFGETSDGSEPTETLPLTESDSTALATVFQLFAGNGLHAYQLMNTQRRLDQANLLSQISQAITSTLDLHTVFNQATEMAASILNAQAATLFSIDTKQRELVFMIAKGAAAQALEEKRIPIEQGVVGWVAVHGEPLVINNTKESPLFNSTIDSQTGFSTRNILCVPLRIQDRTIGVLEVLNKETAGGFTQDDVEWLSAMARPIAIALENAQLYENLRREQERIIKAQEEVRNQLARELHDNTAQMLSLIIMNLDLAQQLLTRQNFERLEAELRRIDEYAKQANREVRTLLFELRPIILESRGLVPALHAYHRQLQGSVTSKIHLDAEPLGVEISLQGGSIIFSIIQEAVNNIRKHARAKNIWIRISLKEKKLHFSIEDDGVGFDLAAVSANYADRGSFGLFNMRERAALLAGYLDIHSPRPHSSNGTLITGFAPLSSMISGQESK